MRPKNIAVVYLEPYGEEEKRTSDLVKDILNKNKIKFNLIKREDLNKKGLKENDLVIVLGGDGTFLRTSHFVDGQLIFGVNCSCKFREGFFLKSNLNNFKENFENLLKDKFRVIKLNRIKAVIDGKETVPALNELYVGSEKAYKTFNYKIKLNEKEEAQKSSGVLIATAAGSHAWMKSAGGNVFDIESDELQYFVREPYRGKLTRPSLLIGEAKEGKFEMVSLTNGAIVIADSTSEEYGFGKGKLLKIKKAEPLQFVEFN